MARTQSADYDAKREAITVHAAKLFAEKGFATASVADIAESCAVSKSLIYHYYKSKEEILLDVMSDHIDDLMVVVAADFEKNLSPADQFQALTTNLLQHYVGAAESQKVLLYELPSLPQPLRQEIVQKQRRIVSHVETILAAAKPSLQGDRSRLRAETMLYFGMLNWTHTWFRPKGVISRDALARIAASLMLGGE